jgi:integrase
MAVSPASSELLFPTEGGGMFPRSTRLQAVLRRALTVAGVVKGFKHVCRKHGCGYSVRAPDATALFCETQTFRKLCPKLEVRALRFHDLRHTTASLLLMAGAPLQSVQQIMRHSDPKLTAVRYGHLSHDYLGAEINRLSFSPPVEAASAEPARVAAGAEDESFGATLGASPSRRRFKGRDPHSETIAIPGGYLVGASGVEPPTSTVSR